MRSFKSWGCCSVIQHLSSHKGCLGFHPHYQKEKDLLGTFTHYFNPSTWEIEAVGPVGQGQAWLYSEFKASLCQGRPFSKGRRGRRGMEEGSTGRKGDGGREPVPDSQYVNTLLSSPIPLLTEDKTSSLGISFPKSQSRYFHLIS